MENKPLTRFWIFQSTPERYDLIKNLHADQTDEWPVQQYKKHIKENDIVLFLQSGEQSAFHGWGTVTKVRHEKDNYITHVLYQERLRTPLPLYSLSEDDVLQYASRLRFSQGTVFKLTTLEMQALLPFLPRLEKIHSNAIFRPDFPADILNEYSFSRTPLKILNATVEIAPEIIQPEDLLHTFIILLQQRHQNDINRNDTTTFLNRFIPPSPSEKVAGDAIVFEKDSETDIALFPDIDAQGINSISGHSSGLLVDNDTLTLFQLAKTIAIRTTNRERIYTRHLLVAFWHNEFLKNQFEESFSELSEVKSAYLPFLEERYPDDNHKEWRQLIAQESDASFQNFIARLNADDPEGKDLLNIGPDVEALASVITAKDIGPPLAIGLFGDWGSGKTFFMNKLKARIHYLSHSTQLNPAIESSYCQYVVPIWFNAWHYLDTNLWASLIDHIFNSLEKYIETRKQEISAAGDRTTFTDPLAKLETIRQLQEIAEKKKSGLEKEKEELNKQIESTGKHIEALDEQLQSTVNQDPLKKVLDPETMALAGTMYNHLQQLYTSWKKDWNVNDTFDPKKGSANLHDLEQLINASKILVGDGRHLWQRILLHMPTRKLAIPLLLCMAITLAGVWFDFDHLTTIIANVMAVGSTVVAFAKKQLSTLHSVIDITGEIKQKGDKLFQMSQLESEKQMEVYNSRLTRLKEEQLTNKQQLSDVHREIRELEQKEDQFSGVKRLVNFINDRARSQDYSKHLGLISMVRKDFEQLTTLMCPPENGHKAPSPPIIERIVLFIDDLDRCPEEKVMEVLQAVHLLLAFRLFVVVVGVDARWISRSIKTMHPHLLMDQDITDHRGTYEQGEATTRDYLEKIFQIPFWLRRLDSSNLIENLIKGTIAEVTDITELNAGENPMTDQEKELPLEDANNKQSTANDDTEDDPEYEGLDLKPDFLSLNDMELRFMGLMGPIAGQSPRAIKRYLNLYRLIKATYSDMQRPSFQQPNGGYAEVQLLLAIQSGQAYIYNRFVDALRRTKAQDFQNFVTHLPKDDAPTFWNEFIHLLKSISQKEEISLTLLRNHIDKTKRYSYHYSSVEFNLN